MLSQALRSGGCRVARAVQLCSFCSVPAQHNMEENMCRVKQAFLAGVDSVQPHKLITDYVSSSNNKLLVNGVSYDLNKNVFIVGFGKAVAGMVGPLVGLLQSPTGSHLRRGIISIPKGLKHNISGCPTTFPEQDCVMEVMEGAENNIPDQAAFCAAQRIVSLVQGLRQGDVLLVLISGGGSALLPYPTPPLLLEEKRHIIQALSRAGATITELNTVRKALSLTKGGRLVQETPATVISLIISDIINSPLDMIASGPTVPNTDPPGAATQVLARYGVMLPDHVRPVLEQRTAHAPSQFPHVTNIIIGDNEKALAAVQSVGRGQGVAAVVSSTLQGEAAQVGAAMARLATLLTQALGTTHLNHFPDSLMQQLHISTGKQQSIIELVAKCKKQKCPLWLIFGGETTVTVRGGGRGGRNQEMVLAASLSLEQEMSDSDFTGDIIFLSGGTDGIDGPTDAAGAITFWAGCPPTIRSQAQEARAAKLRPEDFLAANNTYEYYCRLGSGQYLLQPGPTGTNVMDIQIMAIFPQ